MGHRPKGNKSAYLRQGTSYQYRDTDPDLYQNLITGPLPNFPENFMQIRSEVFAQSC